MLVHLPRHVVDHLYSVFLIAVLHILLSLLKIKIEQEELPAARRASRHQL
jgi:hypothetical protein